ncbi:MAG: calcium/sodium antiporter [Verrucomicrobiae bacterium]|nr:calcium/sodium antiporter [Verrucomicrobiae bacterium]
MMVDLAMLLGGLVLVVKGGDWFVAAATRIAEFLRMPRVVIGSTLVSLATTTPELVVSVTAGIKGEAGLAVGNAVGSVLCNIGLVLGVTAAIKHVDIHWRALRVPLLVMIGLGVLVFLLSLDQRLARAQGALLLALGAGYFILDFVRTYRDRKPEDLMEAEAIEKEVQAAARFLETKTGAAVQFITGALVVVLGSRLLVDGAVSVAGKLGIPSIVVGLTVVAVGTSLPELVTAITSARKQVSDLSVGNVLGANIANLTLILGAAAVFQDIAVNRATLWFNLPAMLAMMLLLAVFLRSDRRVSRREGLALMMLYGLYLAGVVLLTLAAR